MPDKKQAPNTLKSNMFSFVLLCLQINQTKWKEMREIWVEMLFTDMK